MAFRIVQFWFLVSVFLSFTIPLLLGQEIDTNEVIESPFDIFFSDSIPVLFLDSVTIWGKMNYNEIRYNKRYKRKKEERLRKNIKTVYPYAKAAGKKIKEINKTLPSLKTKKDRKKYLHKEYKQLMKIYKKPIMKLQFSQGKLLFLLIDRETKHSTYYHIKELRGSIPAVLWQTLAKLFGYNLKTKYQPYGKHYKIERIVLQIERKDV